MYKVKLWETMTLSMANLISVINSNGRRREENYKEGRSQRLKSEEANERNQDKKAIAADS